MTVCQNIVREKNVPLLVDDEIKPGASQEVRNVAGRLRKGSDGGSRHRMDRGHNRTE